VTSERYSAVIPPVNCPGVLDEPRAQEGLVHSKILYLLMRVHHLPAIMTMIDRITKICGVEISTTVAKENLLTRGIRYN